MVKFSWLSGLFFSAALLLTSHASSECTTPPNCSIEEKLICLFDIDGNCKLCDCFTLPFLPCRPDGCTLSPEFHKSWLLSAETTAAAPSIAWNSLVGFGTTKFKKNGKIVSDNFTTTLFDGLAGEFTNHTLENKLNIGQFLVFDADKGILVIAIRIPSTDFIDLVILYARKDKNGDILELEGVSVDRSNQNGSPIRYSLTPIFKSKAHK